MAQLRIFCLPDELEAWLRQLSEHFDLAALAYRSGQDGGALWTGGGERLIDDATYRAFLMPTAQQPPDGLAMNDVRSRDNGYLDVEPGRFSSAGAERFLLHSAIVGEDFERDPVHPARFVRWLKRRVKKEAVAGVVAWNAVSGGSSRYRDIWHTQAARDLYSEGVAWKQFADGRVRYKPDPN